MMSTNIAVIIASLIMSILFKKWEILFAGLFVGILMTVGYIFLSSHIKSKQGAK